MPERFLFSMARPDPIKGRIFTHPLAKPDSIKKKKNLHRVKSIYNLKSIPLFAEKKEGLNIKFVFLDFFIQGGPGYLQDLAGSGFIAFSFFQDMLDVFFLNLS